jgi:cargo-transport protein YPP1
MLAWIHWLLSEPGLAASRLPKDIMSLFSEISKLQDPPSDYTTVCMLKSVYMKGSYRNQEGDVSGSLAVFKSVIPWVHDHEPKLLSQPQLSLWSEQLLAHTSLTASESVDLSSSGSHERIDVALQAFRHWALFSAKSQVTARDEFGIARLIRQKIEIWKAYYLFLSKLLQHGIDHHTFGEKHTRLHQVGELRRIESTYENELLSVTRFPKAHESNRAIEEWVEQVIRNWEVLCGRSWPEAELGEGGRNAYGRNVLDILYRAATKTFHSTLILRRLFQVHRSLADFSLAYKALDSYLELVTRGKERADKSHKSPAGIDDDETVLRTISEAVEGLSTFGRENEAEKAFQLTGKLEEWTKEYASRQPYLRVNGPTDSDADGIDSQTRRAYARTVEIAHRAIGVGKAFWAVWTPESERRLTYQSEALASFKQAHVMLADVPPSLETAYAQSLLLAETRDLKGAIECVKTSLSTSSSQAAETHYAQQRKIMPFWHLLALLLSARQDFSTAYQMCGAAFDQFSDSNILFGTRAASVDGDTPTYGEKTPSNDATYGLVDDMDGREKERIVEIRMTELALVELVEGAEEAVNGSNELLSLFSRLFGHLGIGREEKIKPKGLAPPKSSAGTVKSLRGSIFGRKRRGPPISAQSPGVNGVPSMPEDNLTRYTTQTTEAPTIRITDEDSKTEKQRSHPFRRSHSHNRSDSHSHKLHKREGSKTSIIHRHGQSAATRPISSVVSSQRQSFETGQEQLPRHASATEGQANRVSEDMNLEGIGPTKSEDVATADALPLHEHNKIAGAKVPLPPVAHNTDHREVPPPPGHVQQPPEQDVRLPIIHPSTTSSQPSPQFPKAAEQIQAYGLLVKVWLFVAGLYRRASLFEDSVEACDESSRNASQIEALVCAQESSAVAFADPGWGGGRSSNEVWADVHTERAHLALAKGMPHEALKQFEEALMYHLDHPKATIGLSNILLDIYEQKIPSEPTRPGFDQGVPPKQKQHAQSSGGIQNGFLLEDGAAAPRAADELRKTPENLNRLAARDRAYGLLSNLTKLGTSWDDSDAWYALARAHECGGQIEKAKEVLWWCVELEDKRPVRHWRNVGSGLYVL